MGLTTLEYFAEVRHDGRLHEFIIPGLRIPVCQACGEKIFTEDVDRQVNDALRSHLHLLSPQQIADSLAALGATQKHVAHQLGIAEATLSRWLTGTQIQSRALDNLLRVFFAIPEVRRALCGDQQNAEFGTTLVSSRTLRKSAL